MNKRTIKKVIICSLFLIFAIILAYNFITENKKSEERAEKFKDVTDSNLLSISFLDVGEGDCTIIQDEDEVMIIDGGNYEYYDKLYKFLEENNIKTVNKLVLSTIKEEHVANAINIINDYNVEEVYMPELYPKEIFMDSVIFSMEANNVKVIYPRMNDTINFGGVDTKYQFIAPFDYERESFKQEDSYSLILKITNLNDSILLASDSTKEEIDDVFLRYREDLNATLYKAADHGSYGNSGNTKEFIDLIKPQYVIITDGSFNEPSEDLVKYMKSNGSTVYKMSEEDQITCISTGNGLFKREE